MTARLRQALLAAGVDKRPKDAFAALNTRGKHWGTSGPSRARERPYEAAYLPGDGTDPGASTARDAPPDYGQPPGNAS